MPRLKKKTKRKFKRGGSSRSTPKSTAPSVSTPRKSKKSKKPLSIKQLSKEELLVSKTKKNVLKKLNNMKRDEIMSVFFPKISIEYETPEIDEEFIKKNFENYSKGDIIYEENIADLKKRDITKINSITIEGKPKKEFKDLNLYFYKSTGSSRPGDNIEGIYFPLNYFPSDDKKIYLFQKDYGIIRIKKPEDHYKIKYELLSLSLTEKELKKIEEESTELLKYGRFITEENALISKYLSLLKCN